MGYRKAWRYVVQRMPDAYAYPMLDGYRIMPDREHGCCEFYSLSTRDTRKDAWEAAADVIRQNPQIWKANPHRTP